MKTLFDKTFILVLICLVILNCITTLRANSELEIDMSSLEQFTSRFYEQQLKAKAPGFYVSFSHDGESLFNQAYGLADIDSNREIDSFESVFRIASISKTLTNIAIIRLEQEGKLSFDNDVSIFFDKHDIDIDFVKGITVHNLLTNNEGYEEYYVANLTKDGSYVAPLDYLREHQSARIFDKGEYLTYGSYSSFILQHIIEEVSGQKFEVYMQESFFKELNMRNSSFSQPIDDDVIEHELVKEYKINTKGEFEEVIFVYPVLSAAGGAYLSGSDITKLLDFISGARDFIDEDGFKLLTSEQYTQSKGVPGISYGLFRHSIQGKEAWIRNGDGTAFRSTIVYIPELKSSLFVYFNSDDDKLRSQFVADFFDTFIESGSEPQFSDFKELDKYSGTYKPIQSAKEGLAKIQILFTGTIKVYIEDGYLVVDPGEFGDVYGGFEQRMRFKHVGDNIFTTDDGNNHIGLFERDGKYHIASSNGYHGVFVESPTFDNPILHIVLLVTWLLILIALTISIVITLVRILLRHSLKHRALMLFLFGLVVLTWTYVIGINYALIIGDGSTFELEIPYYFLGILESIKWLVFIPYLLVIIGFLFLYLAIQRNKNGLALSVGLMLFCLLIQAGYWNWIAGV